ncbi:MAG: cyanophycinase [Bryobacteraceae bacterium]
MNGPASAGILSTILLGVLICVFSAPTPAFKRGVASKPLAKGSGYEYFLTGSATDVSAKPKFGVALMGGGTDQDAAFRWMCDRTGGGDFLVLRASGSDDYNPYIKKLCPALNSVATIIVTSREGASQPFVIDKIAHAEALFISGGSQDDYINFWQNTPLQETLNQRIAKDVPLGGTSAGLAVLGEYNFSALKDTIKSPQALANPFHERVTIGRGFLHVPHLEGKITDSHFAVRDRMGRLVAFLARISTDGGPAAPCGIGIDEKTAVLMEPDGTAWVTGQGAAYFLRPPGPPEQCTPNRPLTYRDVAVYRLKAGPGRFNIASWTGTGGAAYALSAQDGLLKSKQEHGQIY